MKKVYLSLFLILVLSYEITAQDITFFKHLEYGTGHSVVQTEDEGYIASVYGTGEVILIKADKFGELVWKKTYGFSCLFRLKFIPTKDKNYLIIASVKNNDVDNVLLMKFNSNGDSLWTKTFVSTQREVPADIIETSDNGILIYAYVPSTQSTSKPHSQVLYKLDNNFNLQWKHEYEVYHAPSFRNFLSLKEWNNGYVLNTSRYILKVNLNGDSLFAVPLNSVFSFAVDKSTNLYSTGNNHLFKIDTAGNILFDKLLEGGSYGYHLIVASDGNLLICYKFGLGKYSTEGNNIWQNGISTNHGFYYFIQTSDKGFACIDEDGYLIKTDSLGVVHSIQIVSPKENEYLVVGNKYNLIWGQSGINSVKIEFSSDDGITWQNVEEQVIDTLQYQWTIPNSPSGVCKIKISDTQNPNVYDISDRFTIGFNPEYECFSANQINMWIGCNGSGSHNPVTDASGLYWPGGINATIPAVFQDGLIWGGKIDGKIYVNGDTHRLGLTGGPILEDGTAGTSDGIWKIKKDWQSLPAGPERDRYEYCYNNWPADIGAPYLDVNGDNKFTRGVDQPRFLGDEVLWFVANDLDTLRTQRTYGSDPIGLEIQLSTFGYNREDELGDAVFKKYKVINKSGKFIEDMYLSYWTDPDLGDASDDYTGCDTILNLGFCYNGDNNDENYYGENPPAVGYKILQGPVTDGELTDTARFNDTKITGKANLPLTSFFFYLGGMEYYRDPKQGNYTGTEEFYWNMRGFFWNGQPFIDPHTSIDTKFILSGDPVNGNGWYEGKGWPGGPDPNDRRFVMSSGPFNLAAGDTQEVVYAIIMARGTDYLNSVTELKRKAQVVQDFYDSHMPTNVNAVKIFPIKFELYQNYPNPFNPSTTIKYSIPVVETGYAPSLLTSLKVYDILGREVTTLVNEEKPAGNYQVTFDGSNLSSGVYFYQLKAGAYNSTKKLLLVK